MGRVTDADRDFLEAFETTALAKACWSHEAHVRMAWLVLEREGSYPRAEACIRAAIQRFNASVGSGGYHETTTVAFTRLVHHRKQQGLEGETFEAFRDRHPDLFVRSPSVLSPFYAPEDLRSEPSKVAFVEPSRRPLPRLGHVRPVRLEDADAIRRIYAPYVRETNVSFELEPPEAIEMGRRIAKVTADHPWFVFEAPEGIAGYAYGSRHRERAAYRWAAEVSVYVERECRGTGVGQALYGRLLADLRHRGFHVALAGISLPNAPSVRLHEALGFEAIGVYRRIGFKHGAWHDVGWWQKRLVPEGTVPVIS